MPFRVHSDKGTELFYLETLNIKHFMPVYLSALYAEKPAENSASPVF